MITLRSGRVSESAEPYSLEQHPVLFEDPFPKSTVGESEPRGVFLKEV